MLQIISYVVFTVLILLIAKAYLDKKGHPKGLFYLFFAEMWERFSFYGMRALLTLYLIKDYYSHLENNEEVAYGIYAAYGALVYLTPLIGGYLADKFIGYRKSILYGGVLMALGHFFMAFPTDFFFYGALGLLIMGNGFFKPNISTLVGSLYEEGDIKRDGGFTIFYMGINLGAMIAPLFCGYLGEVYGWHYGFGLAGIGMGLGILQYVLGQKYLKHVGNFLGASQNEDEKALMKKPLTKIEKDRVVVLLISFLLVIVFWGAFEQAGGLMNIYTMEKTDRILMGWLVPASWFQSLNAMFIIFLGTSVALFWANRKLKGKVSTSLYKMILGLIIMGTGFFFMTGATAQFESTGSSAMYWLVLAYLFHTVGELCLSPVALSFITKLSPVKYASIMMGVYFAMTGFGSKLAGLLGEWSESLGEYTIFTGIAVFCVVLGGLVLLVRKKLEVLTHGIEDAEGKLQNSES